MDIANLNKDVEGRLQRENGNDHGNQSAERAVPRRQPSTKHKLRLFPLTAHIPPPTSQTRTQVLLSLILAPPRLPPLENHEAKKRREHHSGEHKERNRKDPEAHTLRNHAKERRQRERSHIGGRHLDSDHSL